MFYRFVCLIALAVTLGSVSTISNATVMQGDWRVTGDKDLIYDTTTGLEWLKLTVTQGLFSFNTMQAQLLPGGEFNGFRYATDNELHNLQVSLGLNSHPIDNTVADHAQIEYYQSLFGITQQDIFYPSCAENLGLQAGDVERGSDSYGLSRGIAAGDFIVLISPAPQSQLHRQCHISPQGL